MMKKLIVTNGDSAAGSLRASGVKAEILPWRDPLHLGPVPKTGSFAELSQVRINFLKDDPYDVENEFRLRDDTINNHDAFDEIELWFEHDLHDQLQLIQVIDALIDLGRTKNVSVVQAPSYLAMEPPEKILRFEALKAPLDAHMANVAQNVWRAFREENPREFAACFETNLRPLPFLKNAVERMLQELPGPDGVTRSERQIIYSINRGVTRLGMLFARCSAMEEAMFWGDLGFFTLLSGLTVQGGAQHALIEGIPEAYTFEVIKNDARRKAFITSELALTPLAHEVLSGRNDYAELREINWWWGGTHLTQSNLWRWDWEKQVLLGPMPIH